jgi:hypothetical protein
MEEWQSRGFENPELTNQELNEFFKSPEPTADVVNKNFEWLRNAFKIF